MDRIGKVHFVFFAILYSICFIHISIGKNLDKSINVVSASSEFWSTPAVTNPSLGTNYLYECQITTVTPQQQLKLHIYIFQCLDQVQLIQIVQKAKDFVQAAIYTFNQKFTSYDITIFATSCPYCITDDPLNPVVLCSQLIHSSPSVLNVVFPYLPIKDYTIAICATDESCAKADSSPSNPAYYKFDIREHEPLTNAGIFAPVELYNSFYCNTINSVPLTWIEGPKKKFLQCSCVCKSGYHLDLTVASGKTCKVNEIPKVCDNIEKCYVYSQTKPNKEICSLKGSDVLSTDIFKLKPVDNYVELNTNKYDSSDHLKTRIPGNPHIELSLSNEKAGGIRSIQPTLYYDWKEFELKRKQILNTLEFTSIGKYTLDIIAYDYSGIAAECKIDIVVKDDYHPKSLKQCPNPYNGVYSFTPSKDSPSSSIDSISDINSGISAYKNSLLAYKEWKHSIKNDACGQNNLCSVETFTRQLKTVGTDVPTISKITDIESCFDIDIDYIENLITQTAILNVVTLDCNYKSDKCSICCSFDYTAKEETKSYNCITKQWDTACESASSGSSCSYNNCVDNNRKSFFDIKINVQELIKDNSKDVIKTFPITNMYNKQTEIHFRNDCDNLDSGTCYKTYTLNDLFDVKRLFKKKWNDIFSSFHYLPDKYVKVRYNIDNSGWMDYDIEKFTPIIFTKLITKIVFEAYSLCGTVLQATTFKVFQHPYKALKLCYILEDRGIYQASTGKTVAEAGPICNYPNTNYAEFTIEFDPSIPDIGSNGEYTGYTSFESIKCEFSYQLPDNIYSTAVVIVPSTDKGILNHYALNLIDKPTTDDVTRVKVSCDISYKGQDEKWTFKESCNKEFSVIDCDSPAFVLQTPVNECALDCPTNKPKPFEACHGNIIDYDAGSKVTIFTTEEQKCCDSCGARSCVQIFDNNLQISQCEIVPGRIQFNILQSTLMKVPTKFMSQYGMMAFMTVGIAIAGIVAIIGVATARVYQRIREPATICAEDGYNPLL